MTLKELLTGALLQLDRGTDAQTLESWRDKLTRYLPASQRQAEIASILHFAKGRAKETTTPYSSMTSRAAHTCSGVDLQ